MAEKLTLIERLNSGMTAVDLPPGTLVQYKQRKRNDHPFFAPSEKPAWLSGQGVHSQAKNYFCTEEVESGAYLLYLGVVSIGPRTVTTPGPSLKISGDTIFAHRFYYCEKTLYLEIGRPDRYYTVFRKYITRVDKKNNLCR